MNCITLDTGEANHLWTFSLWMTLSLFCLSIQRSTSYGLFLVQLDKLQFVFQLFKCTQLHNISNEFWNVLLIVYNTRDYWVFGLCPSSKILKNITFRIPNLIPIWGEWVEDAFSLAYKAYKHTLQREVLESKFHNKEESKTNIFTNN
jgi:hypothetical protein